MIDAYPDYGKAIREFYKRKIEHTDCSSALKKLTPGNLKTESIRRSQKLLQKEDIKAIREFLDKGEDVTDWTRALRKTSADKFRPLRNFLKESTEDTDLENLEFLAWLLEFEPRPVNEWNRHYNSRHFSKASEQKERTGIVNQGEELVNPVNLIEEDLAIPTPQNAETLAKPTAPGQTLVGGGPGFIDLVKGANSSHQPLKKFFRQPVIWSAGILFALAIGIYFYVNKPGTTGCMYWNGENYSAIPCNERKGDALIIALDSIRLKNFRRITNEDTITYNAIGHVWYIKRNSRLEYYTERGRHPEDPTKNLKPITKYIIDKYILSKNSGTDSTVKGEATPKTSP